MDVRGRAAAEPVGDVRATLGEGPYWLPGDGILLWVDIHKGLLHRTDVDSGKTDSVELEQASAAFPVIGGGTLVAAGHRLYLFGDSPGDQGNGEEPRVVAEAPARDGVRFNDGAVDPAGRVWIGSMDTDEARPLGDLYRLETTGTLTQVLKGVTVSNGMAWSPDGSRLYYVDSPSCRIDEFDYDPSNGGVYRRRVFADLREADGRPDGLTVDADGCVWVAMWGGAALRRFQPSGRPDVLVPVPVARPTSCAFGGPGLADLFVTTASIGLSETARAAQPLAGRLLRLRPGPVGLPSASAEAFVAGVLPDEPVSDPAGD
jgi:sugar lactone lactonase YvrE